MNLRFLSLSACLVLTASRSVPAGGFIPPDPSEAYLRAGRLAAEGHHAEALPSFEDEARVRPFEPAVLSALAVTEMKLGMRDDAWFHSQLAYAIDPEAPARNLLEPGPGGAPPRRALVRTVHEVEDVCRSLADFRRQDEIRVALARFNIKKGLALTLREADAAAVIQGLFARGYLARAGGPPSGEGRYLTGPDGRIHSSLLGSRDRPRGAAARLLGPPGWIAPEGILLDAIRTGGAAVLEFAFPMLPDRALGEGATELARVIMSQRDPWALDAVLLRLEDMGKRSGPRIPQGLLPALRAILEKGEPLQRWRALALLHARGERGFDPLSAKDLEEVAERVAAGSLGVGALDAALEAMGSSADGVLAGWLASPDDPLLTYVLDRAPRIGGRATAKALVEASEGGGAPWARWSPDLDAALVAWAGKDHGQSPGGWKRWWTRKFAGR